EYIIQYNNHQNLDGNASRYIAKLKSIGVLSNEYDIQNSSKSTRELFLSFNNSMILDQKSADGKKFFKELVKVTGIEFKNYKQKKSKKDGSIIHTAKLDDVQKSSENVIELFNNELIKSDLQLHLIRPEDFSQRLLGLVLIDEKQFLGLKELSGDRAFEDVSSGYFPPSWFVIVLKSKNFIW
ncbi:MAG: hypothetical protein CMO01_22935, partial [Thalassobius sp.]|nr:hypothetical protein [Thalassovita sp.]